jgi:tetratricopeptide (TPR) repeat protein
MLPMASEQSMYPRKSLFENEWMRRSASTSSAQWMHASKFAVLILGLTVLIACNKTNATNTASASDGKIPITTKSEEAKNEFLAARDLADRLLAHESLQHFDRAIELDPDFALAEMARANSSPTAKEFFAHQLKASVLADKVSDGERLMILANEAGANGEVVKQKDYLEKLLAAYPKDERAQLVAGNFYFGQQQLEEAIAHYKKATELAPNFSPTYNILGYSYRQQGDYADAEQAFKKYVELIPNDPNPYDSYAELLLKMGRFDDSIVQYKKALSIDPHFVPSYFGLSADYTYKGDPAQAAADLQTMAEQARNDGELRTAYFGMAVLAADSGQFEKALAAIDKEYAVAEKKNDATSMAADLQAQGNILIAAQKYDDAAKKFAKSLEVTEASSLSEEVKNNARLQQHFNLAAIAIAKKDYASAKKHAEEYRAGAEASKGNFRVRQAHELAGRIALAQKEYNKAIEELKQANEQDPMVLYRISLAYQAKGDGTQANEYAKRAAEFYPLPQLNYAFLRAKAEKAAGAKS